MVAHEGFLVFDLRPVMECGHISAAIYTDEDGNKLPVCSTCIKTNPKAAKEIANLKGRIAVCTGGCGNKQPSSSNLFNFFYTGKNEDAYYDGCNGW